MCTRRRREAWCCQKILQVDDNLLIESDVRILSSIKIQLPTWFQMEIQKEHNIFLGLKSLGITRIGKFCYVKHIFKSLFRTRDYMLVFQNVEIVSRSDVIVDKIPYVENLQDPFTKTLTGRVFVGQRDNIGFR